MDENDLPQQLRETAADQSAKALRMVGAGVPFVGPFLSELTDHIIPNQRNERLVQYTAELAKRVRRIEEKLAARDLSPEQIALFEDGAYASVRATSPDRIKKIARIVADGLNEKASHAEHRRYLLRVVSDLSDVELAELVARADEKTPGFVPLERLSRLESLGVLYTQSLSIAEDGPGIVNGYAVSDIGRKVVEIVRDD